jgi:hypothetical protein
VQKRALRLMTNRRKNKSCRPLFKELKLLQWPACLYLRFCVFSEGITFIGLNTQIYMDMILEWKMIFMYFSVIHLHIKGVLSIWVLDYIIVCWK